METLLPEIKAWPTVLFDKGIGSLVMNIEVDIQYLADAMAQAGMTDADIEGTTVHFTDDTLIDDDGDVHGFGEYQETERTAFVYLGTLSQSEEELKNDEVTEDATQEDLIESTNEFLSEIVLHELCHAIDYRSMGDEALLDEAFTHYLPAAKLSLVTRMLHRIVQSKFLSESGDELLPMVADLVKSDRLRKLNKHKNSGALTHDMYLNEPSEIRAREFSETIIRDITVNGGEYPLSIDLRTNPS